MTRNEAIKEFREIDQEIKRNTFLISFDELIHKIYNDFEKELEELNNRSCGNCKHSIFIEAIETRWCMLLENSCTILKYCSEFKAKR